MNIGGGDGDRRISNTTRSTRDRVVNWTRRRLYVAYITSLSHARTPARSPAAVAAAGATIMMMMMMMMTEVERTDWPTDIIAEIVS